jgi:hypothetical protein
MQLGNSLFYKKGLTPYLTYSQLSPFYKIMAKSLLKNQEMDKQKKNQVLWGIMPYCQKTATDVLQDHSASTYVVKTFFDFLTPEMKALKSFKT